VSVSVEDKTTFPSPATVASVCNYYTCKAALLPADQSGPAEQFKDGNLSECHLDLNGKFIQRIPSFYSK
jgi:hypothetical protein